MKRYKWTRCLHVLRLATGGMMLLAATSLKGATDPWADFFKTHDSGGRPFDAQALDEASDQWRRLPSALPAIAPKTTTLASPTFAPPPPASGVMGTVWKPIGPSPLKQGDGFVNGRVRAIAVNPHNPNLIYQGASGGGVWRSIDAGAHWTPLFDQQVSLAIGQPSALAIDPNDTDTLYVGTSSAFQFFPVTPDLNKGILKSTDGGGSWVVLGSGFPAGNTGNAKATFTGRQVNVISVDPANSSILYAAASSGLYRSTDGGLNWTLGTGGGGGNAQSLVLDTSSPANARVLFAGVNNSGIRQSTDGGQNWTPVLTASTPAVAAALPANSRFGKIIVALAPPAASPNPAGVQVLYVTMEGVCTVNGCGVADPLGIFESTDQGATWTKRAAAGLGGCQCFFTLEMGVDPASPGDGANDILYWGGTGLFRSTDSGASFTDVGNGQHVDHHASPVFIRRPGLPSIVYVGNDGGIYRSEDDGAHWTGTGKPGAPATINAGGLQTTLLYTLDMRNDSSASVTLAALQDNGTAKTTGSLQWTDHSGGDGFFVKFDKNALDTAYAIIGCDDSVEKSTDAGDSYSDITDSIPSGELGCSIRTIYVDPNNAGVIYFPGGSNGLYQSTSFGSSWRLLNNFGAGLDSAAVALGNSNIVAVVRGPQVWVSQNALAATVGPPTGVTFENITRNLPGSMVTRLAFDPNDPTVLYATVAGLGGGNIFRTTLAGTLWENLSPPVSISCNSIALDGASTPTTIYVGTDLGVIRSVDGGASWTRLDDIHLPNVPVTEIAINPQASILRVSTYGRGAFELAAPEGPVIAVNEQNGGDFGPVCPGAPQRLTLQVFNVGNSNLIINSVSRLTGSSDFSVLPNPSTPLIISPNAEVNFTVQYTPGAPGLQQAIIRISSSDPAVPFLDLTVTATRTNAIIATVIADTGDFGDVCVGAFKDLDLTINNNGACDLLISNITTTLSQFKVAAVVSYPLVVHPGNSVAVPIRFQPTSVGAKTAMIAVLSNDPNTPTKLVSVSGNAPAPSVRVTGSTDFGDVCAGRITEKTIALCNVGACDLHVSSVSFVPACPDFTLINNAFPATVSPDSCLNVVIRLTPTACGPKTCTLVIATDDPVNPTITIVVTANTPCPEIDVSPDLAFEPEVIQSVGSCSSPLPFPISNKGQCNLTITSIVIGGVNAGDYALSGLPSFPIILEPGHIAGEGDLNVLFKPTEVARERRATITVTYISDPVTGATMSVTRQLCGEGVRTGARVLVMQGGVPLAMVEKIQLQRINANRNKGALDTQDVARNLPLVTVIPSPPCLPFQYHREYGTVSNPIQLLPGSYEVTVSAIVNGKRKSMSVGFDVSTCDFNPNVVVRF